MVKCGASELLLASDDGFFAVGLVVLDGVVVIKVKLLDGVFLSSVVAVVIELLLELHKSLLVFGLFHEVVVHRGS